MVFGEGLGALVAAEALETIPMASESLADTLAGVARHGLPLDFL